MPFVVRGGGEPRRRKEITVPTFIDYHDTLPPLPPEAAQQMAARVKAGKADEFGVRPLNVLLGKGHGWCLTAAPDAAAVVAMHKAAGFALRRSEVKEVTPLVGL
jgi:hypothetical protein